MPILEETVRSLLLALSTGDAREVLSLCGLYHREPEGDELAQADLACRLWQARAGAVERIRRDSDKRFNRVIVRVFDHSGALLAIPFTLSQDESQTWNVRGVELEAQQFQSTPIRRPAPVTMDFLIAEYERTR